MEKVQGLTREQGGNIKKKQKENKQIFAGLGQAILLKPQRKKNQNTKKTLRMA